MDNTLIKVIRVNSRNVLPDNAQWTNRFQVAGSTGNLYTIAQSKTKRHWGCDCPGWRAHRKCKHLAAIGLPAHEKPFEVRLERGNF